MGYIKEPVGVDFIVDPTPPTNEEAKLINEAIALYKATGKKITYKKEKSRLNEKRKVVVKKRIIAE